MKWIRFTAASTVVVIAGVFAALQFGNNQVRELEQQVDELQLEKVRLVKYAQRLAAHRRVAQIHVVAQRVEPEGRTVNTLLWQEIAADGLLGKPQALEAIGDLVYFEAQVIKFQHELVGQGDERRGTSLVLFRRIFGEMQAPDTVTELDRMAPPPTAEPDSDQAHQTELWQRFWDIADDPTLASRYGVRVAQIEAPAVRLRAGQIWEASLDAAGGLNLRKIAERTPPQTFELGAARVRRP